jgi:mycofactocin precursor
MPESATQLLDPPATDETDLQTVPAETGDILPADVVAADLLVEEISIDGMCGVY